MGFKDYYRILGIKPDATNKIIKNAFRKKASESHPDKHPEGEINRQIFQDISEAYDILVRPDSRREYDKKYSEHHQGELKESGTQGGGIRDYDDNRHDPEWWTAGLFPGFPGRPHNPQQWKKFSEGPDHIHYDDLLKGQEDW